MKRRVCCILLTSFLALFSFLSGSGPAAAGTAAIQERGQLLVAMYAGERDLFFSADEAGQLQGLDVFLAAEIAAALGVELVLIRTAQSFDEVVQQVAAGRADLGISKLSVTLERALRVRFSDPYITLQKTFLINRLELAALQTKYRELSTREIMAAAALTIGAVEGTAYLQFAQDLAPNSTIVPFPSAQTLFAAVHEGTVAAVLWDDLTIRSTLNTNPTLGLFTTMLPLVDEIDPLAIAIAPEYSHFAYWINLFLRQPAVIGQIEAFLEAP